MEVLRVVIRGWTASFRVPMFISGHQPTLPVPPLSAIYGLLGAISGNIIPFAGIRFGYNFRYSGRALDTETVYELDNKEALKFKTNVIMREILFSPHLTLYMDNTSFEKHFLKPVFPVLLGRSMDLAFIENLNLVKLQQKEQVRISGTLLPFPIKNVAGPIMSLPSYISPNVPRKPEGIQPFYILEDRFDAPVKKTPCQSVSRSLKPQNLYYDEELDKGVFIY